MNKEKILKKAIEKAEKNGYPKELSKWLKSNSNLTDLMIYSQFIFDHDFAKEFWGEDKQCNVKEYFEGEDKVSYELYEWQYHLQQMVLEENPILYLEQFLED